MKKHLTIFVLCLIAGPGTNEAFGQRSDFSGQWKLAEHASLIGPDYENGVPDVIKITQTNEEITFERGSEDTLKETVGLDGMPSERRGGRSGAKIVSKIAWPNPQSFVETVEHFTRNDDKQIKFVNSETWTLSDSGKTLTVLVVHKSPTADRDDNKENWSMKGVYKRQSSATAAEGTGALHFEEGLSWGQILAKAKAENKMIFVDCYATWCGPCKEMDKEVYSDPKVGAYFNEHFISVKVQMDTTKQDSDFVQSWRAEAKILAQAYKIDAYPAFLVFSPEGKALHKAIGQATPDELIDRAEEAMKPERQYYTLLGRYQSREDYTLAPALVKAARSLNEKDTSAAIARDYVENYVSRLPEAKLATAENINFMAAFYGTDPHNTTLGSAGRVFQVLRRQAEDAALDSDTRRLARDFTDTVIKSEEINDRIWSAWSGPKETWETAVKDPAWDAFAAEVTRKYDAKTAARVVLNGKLTWFSFTKDAPMFAKCYLDRIDRDGLDTKKAANAEFLNNINWYDIFEKTGDPVLLGRATAWQRKIAVQHPDDPRFADTLANLLYRSGKVDEAIAIERAAVNREDANAAESLIKSGHVISPRKDYRENEDKMTKGLPTWDTRLP